MRIREYVISDRAGRVNANARVPARAPADTIALMPELAFDFRILGPVRACRACRYKPRLQLEQQFLLPRAPRVRFAFHETTDETKTVDASQTPEKQQSRHGLAGVAPFRRLGRFSERSPNFASRPSRTGLPLSVGEMSCRSCRRQISSPSFVTQDKPPLACSQVTLFDCTFVMLMNMWVRSGATQTPP
jgi:hypothetical protein